MKLLFVAYRWGSDIVGGAEIHHRRLVKDLLELGHEVEVWTTTARDFSPCAHWGVDWKAGYPAGERIEDGVRVRRFPMQRAPRSLVGLGAKYLQWRMEKTWEEIEPQRFADLLQLAPGAPCVHLLDGWHLPEIAGDGALTRWSWRRGRLALAGQTGTGTLWISGHAPRWTPVAVTLPVGLEHRTEVDGWFSVSCPVEIRSADPVVVGFRVERPWRPLKDHRQLGVSIREVAWQPAGASEPTRANLWDDHRAIGRRHPDVWWDLLWRRAEALPLYLGSLFDWLRGPRSPELFDALARPPRGCHAVLAANLPWSTVAPVSLECPLPLMIMPLWHMEDDYYYWPHTIRALCRARLVLANTEYSADRFFRPRGIQAEFVGPGVPLPPEPRAEFDPMQWRRDHGIRDGEALILSVCRKSAEKRYDLVAEAVGLLRAQGRPVRFMLVGPDQDRRPLPPDVVYAGRMLDSELDEAYRSCDAFVLMSESESFGMVLAEAWLREKPVVASEFCGPAASLIDPGVDGLLARDAPTLAAALAQLLDDPERARRMGEAGCRKSRERFVQRAATLRLIEAMQAHRILAR